MEFAAGTSRLAQDWTPAEQAEFLVYHQQLGGNSSQIAELMGTRTTAQVRVHSHRYFAKLGRQARRLQASPFYTGKTQAFLLQENDELKRVMATVSIETAALISAYRNRLSNS